MPPVVNYFHEKKLRTSLNSMSQILRFGKGFLMSVILPIAEPLSWKE